MVGATVMPTQNYVNLEITELTASGYLELKVCFPHPPFFFFFKEFYFKPQEAALSFQLV